MNTPMSPLKGFSVIPAVALLALIIPRSATFLTDLVWPWVSAIDPEKVFLRVDIGHPGDSNSDKESTVGSGSPYLASG